MPTTTLYGVLLESVRTANPSFALRHTKEPEQTFLKRLLTELADIPEEHFDALPQEGQEWFNHAVTDELNQKRPVTPPEGFETGPAADDGPREVTRPRRATMIRETGNGEDHAAAPAAAPTAAAEPARVPEPEPAPQAATAPASADEQPRRRGRRAKVAGAAPSERKPRGEGRRFGGPRMGMRKPFSVRSLRKMVLENPAVTIEQMLNAAKQAGEEYSPTTANLARNQALEMIEAAKELGRWQ